MMRESSERERKMLAGAMVLLVAILAWQFVVPAIQGWLAGQQARTQADRRVAQTRAITKNPVVMLRMNALKGEAGTYEPNRNIFRYGQVKVVRRPPPPPAPRPEPVVRQPPPPREPPPPSKPRPPAIDFELMGIFGPENRRIAVLMDGTEIINALQDDVVKEQFIVNEIGLQSVEFRFVDFPADETARIEIGER